MVESSGWFDWFTVQHLSENCVLNLWHTKSTIIVSFFVLQLNYRYIDTFQYYCILPWNTIHGQFKSNCSPERINGSGRMVGFEPWRHLKRHDSQSTRALNIAAQSSPSWKIGLSSRYIVEIYHRFIAGDVYIFFPSSDFKGIVHQSWIYNISFPSYRNRFSI